jgi:hypothetical protein
MWGSDVIMWDQCYHMVVECYHVGWNVGSNVIM